MPQRLGNLAVTIESPYRNLERKKCVCAMTSRRGPHCFDTKRATEDGKAFRHYKVSIIRIV